MQIKFEASADGRNLVRVRFTPQTEDPAKTPTVDVVFEILPAGKTTTLFFVSATRTDTRETVSPSQEEMNRIRQAVSLEIAEMDDAPLWSTT